jgi:low temperature requirement protein LtrA
VNKTSIVSPENQSVTFVELFFDLVFVFSVTQVVGLLHDGITPDAVGRSILVFWLVWWAWTQFTWALNAANTTHPVVELGTLFATAVAFFMAVALPEAFEGRGLWFAVPYVLVRSIGLTLYSWVARVADPAQHAAVRYFWLVSSGASRRCSWAATSAGTCNTRSGVPPSSWTSLPPLSRESWKGGTCTRRTSRSATLCS